MIKKSSIISAAALCAIHLAASEKTETITIENRYYKTIKEEAAYKSVTMPRLGETAEYFKTPDGREAMARLFTKYGLKSFRYHYPDKSSWDHPEEMWKELKRTKGVRKSASYLIPDKEYIKWLDKNNLKAGIQVPIKIYFDPVTKRIIRLDKQPEYIPAAAKSIAGFVKWVKDNNYQHCILYWELGNESYNGKDKALTPLEAAKIDFAFMKAMKKVDPSIKIAIDGQSPEHPGQRKAKTWSGTVGQWHKQFLSELVRLEAKDGDFDFISQHCYAHWINDVPFNYPEQNPPGPIGTWNLLKAPKVTQIGSVEANAAFLKSLGFNKVKIQANEFKRGASHMWYSRTMMHALAQADPLFYFIKNPAVEGAVIHSVFNNGKFALHPQPWKLHTLGWAIFTPTPDGKFIVSPIAVMYQLIDRLLSNNDKILKISGGSASVAAYGDNKLKFIVVNKEDDAASARINLKGFKLAGPATVNVYTLKSDKLTDFPVHPITKKRIKFEVVKSTLKISSTDFNYVLPRYSFVLFEIPGIKMPNAEKIAFTYKPPVESSYEDAMDFYETKKSAISKTNNSVFYVDFSNTSIQKIAAETRKEAYKFRFDGFKDSDFTKDGLRFRGEQRVSVIKLDTPKKNIRIDVIFKADPQLKNAMVVAEHFHFTGIGIMKQKLFTSIKTAKKRYRFHSAKWYPPNKWLQMTLTYDGKTASTYLNGELLDSNNLSGEIITDKLVIGGTISKSQGIFKGYIKKVAISRLEP